MSNGPDVSGERKRAGKSSMRRVESTSEWVTMRRPGSLPGVEVYQGVCTTSYPRQIPEEYRVGVVTRGAQIHAYRGDRRVLAPGQLLLLPPGEVVAGSAVEADGYAWSLLALDARLVREAMAALGARDGAVPVFSEVIVPNHDLAREFVRLHRLLTCQDEEMGTGAGLEQEGRLIAFLTAVLDRYAGIGDLETADLEGGGAVRLAREWLDDCYAAAVPLAELVRVSGAVSTFSLVRAFTRIVGLPPHAYQNHLRVQQARRLLIKGGSPADVAQAVGFSDQSHMSRRFTPIVGVPPGAYRRTRPGSVVRRS